MKQRMKAITDRAKRFCNHAIVGGLVYLHRANQWKTRGNDL